MKKLMMATVLALSFVGNANAYDPVKGAASVSVEWYCHEYTDILLDVRDSLRKGADYTNAAHTAERTRSSRLYQNYRRGIHNRFQETISQIILDGITSYAAEDLARSDIWNINADTFIRQRAFNMCADDWNDIIANDASLVDGIILLQTN